ncbi:iron complex transport system permease protein [Stackebrandtia endophytica]|uniref:Iron complex transport system permease protein n=1 Tax=Stackebrandtia endophytica TaxID=1496996 RepID=A0A543AU08_9ACTN|nr:iron ABC transporter permease [Stackebrandtia endophytica]TQL76058.1 iron complex transport system permease protein [Stackebrandtia endophytica]
MTLTGERLASVSTDGEPPPPQRISIPALIALIGAILAGIVVLAGIHLTQGTADVGVADLWAWVTGSADDQAAAIVIASRLPRLTAALVVGLGLGAAGCVMQSISRNPLAAPDTLAVNAGAHLSLVVAATFGISAPFLGQLGLAFAGGLAAALLVLVLTGTEYGTVRLVLGGSAVALALTAVTTSLMILFPFEARGLYAWASGTLGVNGFGGISLMAPIVAAGIGVLLLLGRRLDLLMLGDDEARALGVPVRQTQLMALLVGVLLATAAVALTGPIGFIGLAAPALIRLLSSRVPGLHRHRALIPVSGLAAVALLLAADVGLRTMLGAQTAVQVPTGVMTSIVGAIFLVVLAFRLRSGRLSGAGSTLDVRGIGVRYPKIVVSTLVALLIAAVLVSLLIGDRMLLLGDVANWVTGQAGPLVSGVMETRAPRVLAALLAGIALATAGAAIQGVTRNPLAEPAIIGVSGGASVGAVLVVTLVPLAGFWMLAGAAGLGALLAAAIVFGLAARSGFATDRLVLIGVGVSYGTAALVTLLIVVTDPFNATKALTWLSGSTYGRTVEHLIPLSIGCLVLVPLVFLAHRQLDLLSVDDDTPRMLGVNVPAARFGLLISAVLLTAVAVAGIGVIGFVGLVGPHAARMLMGRRHSRVIPVGALLGGTLVVIADLVGRTVISPDQLPAGLMTAIIGAPYFFWLLYRSRAT